MKINKSILAVALCLGMAGSSYAGNVYLSGSTACRSTVYNTLNGSNVVFNGFPAVTSYKGSSASGGTYMAFQGTLKGGSGTTTILCSWSGSEGGILNIASNTVPSAYAPFLKTADINTASNSVVFANTEAPAGYDSLPVQLAMADNDKAYSRTPNANITGTNVCIITFKWIRNTGLWTGASPNVSDYQIRQSLAGGCPLSVFTGNSNDVSYVYVSGRDNLSGTRVNAFANAGFGIFGSPAQIILVAGSMQTNSAGRPVDNYYDGDFGQTSGGTLAGTLTNSTVSSVDQIWGGTGFSVLGYLGYDDAQKALSGGGTECTYNGVPFSINNIVEGTYTFWGNEYVYKAANVTSGEPLTVYNSLALNIKNFCYPHGTATLNGIDPAIMHTTRSSPITPPSHN